MAATARTCGLAGVAWRHADLPDADLRMGLTPSHCIVLAREAASLEAFATDARRYGLEDAGRRPWTDDHFDITAALAWRPEAMGHRP